MSHEVYQMKEPSSEKLSFKLLYITQSEYDKGWHSTSHTHHFTELFYIVKGKGAFILPDKEVPVQENDLVIINPNTEHTERSNEKDSLEYIALGIEGVSFSLPDETSAHKTSGTTIGLYTYREERQDVFFYLNRLLEEVQQSQEAFDIICQNIIEILIIKLRRGKKFTIQKTTSKNMNKAVAFAKHFINQNFRDPLTLDSLAEIAHINKYHLAHTFKHDIGLSPIEHLINVRIREAKILLETTDYTIGDIAVLNGFSSQSFFTQAFKRETHYTPSQYRKATQNKANATSH